MVLQIEFLRGTLAWVWLYAKQTPVFLDFVQIRLAEPLRQVISVRNFDENFACVAYAPFGVAQKIDGKAAGIFRDSARDFAEPQDFFGIGMQSHGVFCKLQELARRAYVAK